MGPMRFRELDLKVVYPASRIATNSSFSTRNEGHLLASGLLPTRSLFVRRCALQMDRIVRNTYLSSYASLLRSHPNLRNGESPEGITWVPQEPKATFSWAIPTTWARHTNDLPEAVTFQHPPEGETFWSSFSSRANELNGLNPPPAADMSHCMTWSDVALTALERTMWNKDPKPAPIKIQQHPGRY